MQIPYLSRNLLGESLAVKKTAEATLRCPSPSLSRLSLLATVSTRCILRCSIQNQCTVELDLRRFRNRGLRRKMMDSHCRIEECASQRMMPGK